MSKLVFFILVSMLSACALKNTNLYGSENIKIADQAVLSAIGVYNNGFLGIQITSINGEPVDMLKTASFMVPSGTYKIKLHANKDLGITRVTDLSSTGPYTRLGSTKQVFDDEISISVQGGHTYIPNAHFQGNKIQFIFDDKGKGFPWECLPLYKVVNNSSNPGFIIYRTDNKCVI